MSLCVVSPTLALAPIAVGVVLALFVRPTGWLMLGACIAVYAVVYGASMWLIGMNRYEKDLIMRPLGKILRRFGVKV